jgi:dimethylhistidine N-methyltransferase
MAQPAANLSFHDLRPAAQDFLQDVLTGLASSPKQLPPKYFYDERGSALFEAICETPEYYPTRVETALMQRHGSDMAALLGPRCALIEYGSGNSRKTRILLERLAPVAYLPIDISRQQLEHAAGALAREFPQLRVAAVCADYSQPIVLPLLETLPANRRIVYFPGSTIGNFSVAEAEDFLRNAAQLAGPGGGLLIGVDVKKDERMLNAAYNDAQGLTAQFNLNVLARIARELDADIVPARFRHYAFYRPTPGRIEMHLVSREDHEVTVHGQTFRFRAHETIHTENSHKYAPGEFQALAAKAGFKPVTYWIDESKLFSVHYMTC